MAIIEQKGAVSEAGAEAPDMEDQAERSERKTLKAPFP